MNTERIEDELARLKALRIAANFDKRMRALEHRAPSAAVPPEFARLCDRVAGLWPVKRHLARAARRGEFGIYLTRVDGRPVAFTASGWSTREMLG